MLRTSLLFLGSLGAALGIARADDAAVTPIEGHLVGATVSAEGAQAGASFKPLPAPADLALIADRMLADGFTKVPYVSGQSRWEENRQLNAEPVLGGARRASVCTYEGQDTLIIALEGTGAFQSRISPAMQALNMEMQKLGYDVSDPAYDPYKLISESFHRATGKDPNWSGLNVGPLNTLLKTPGVAGSFRSYSFPSEETEALSDSSAIWSSSLDSFGAEMVDSNMGMPKSVVDANNCITELLFQAMQQRKTPKVVIMSHSSGGRTAVKLLETLKERFDGRRKENGINIDLVFTIDPVKEAHEALGEAFEKLWSDGTSHNLNKLGDLIGIPPSPVPPTTINQLSQPSKLYRPTNALRHVNFYQRQDTLGLKMEPKFGILGAQIEGADINTEILPTDGVGAAGHGEVTYAPKVTQAFIEELRRLRGLGLVPEAGTSP